jgi:hypothetical protein
MPKRRRRNPAAPVAPTRPAPGPRTPSTPAPSRPSPFTPTKPAVMPRPKLSFWSDIPPSHAFFGHPVLQEFGEQLSNDALREIGRRVDLDNCIEASFRAYSAITEAESGYEPTLTDLARTVVETVWGIPPDQLKGGIGEVEGDVAGMDLGEDDSEEPKTLWDLGPSEASEVQKRLLINTIIQGCAIHAMLNNPRMVQRELAAISPDLPQFYEQFAWNSLAMYWKMDYEQMNIAQLRAQAAGFEEFKYERREDREVPVVYSKGINFPVMLQEFVKGVAEVVCLQSFSNLPPDTQAVVVEMADKVQYEPYQIKVGPQIWRRLLTKVGRDEGPADFLMRLSMMEPDELMDFVADAIKGDENA